MLKNLFSFIFIDRDLKDDVKFLKTVPLFAGVADRALSKIALLIFKKTALEGEIVFSPRQEAQVIYIVKSGSVQLVGDGKEKTIKAGGYFGEIAFIKDSKHNISAKALENSELYLIYRIKFEDFAESDGKTGFKIMKNFLNSLGAKFNNLEI
ncbi:MAG: cyclic nucleotide-binding domain-containing protein [Endomicrobium sp.]|jgi:CRP-like cAMP-binding protein|nr:cyclic nucleotide-binding domain-containing protein [Endomicrobium sp.]